MHPYQSLRMKINMNLTALNRKILIDCRAFFENSILDSVRNGCMLCLPIFPVSVLFNKTLFCAETKLKRDLRLSFLKTKTAKHQVIRHLRYTVRYGYGIC